MYPCGFGVVPCHYWHGRYFMHVYYAPIKKTIDQKHFYYQYFFCFNSTPTRSQTTESKKQLPLFQQNVITHSQLGPKGSEVIGWRLATQESCSGFHFTKELSPAVLNKSPSKGQYHIDMHSQTVLHAWIILSFVNSTSACRNIPG